ncbi:Uncharacterized protein HZ326_21140 [Fusarium oxysporum f. sp. albedinis]|jgi:hypothetical protein|nr:Uncharacterized protein HZ326_21140 [Fusarium oxysporum f. sp. albedinis]
MLIFVAKDWLYAKAESVHNVISQGGVGDTANFIVCGGVRRNEKTRPEIFLLRLSDRIDSESWKLAKGRANHRSLAAQGYKYSPVSRRTQLKDIN